MTTTILFCATYCRCDDGRDFTPSPSLWHAHSYTRTKLILSMSWTTISTSWKHRCQYRNGIRFKFMYGIASLPIQSRRHQNWLFLILFPTIFVSTLDVRHTRAHTHTHEILFRSNKLWHLVRYVEYLRWPKASLCPFIASTAGCRHFVCVVMSFGTAARGQDNPSTTSNISAIGHLLSRILLYVIFFFYPENGFELNTHKSNWQKCLMQRLLVAWSCLWGRNYLIYIICCPTTDCQRPLSRILAWGQSTGKTIPRKIIAAIFVPCSKNNVNAGKNKAKETINGRERERETSFHWCANRIENENETRARENGRVNVSGIQNTQEVWKNNNESTRMREEKTFVSSINICWHIFFDVLHETKNEKWNE